jgi:hypothetical protein
LGSVPDTTKPAMTERLASPLTTRRREERLTRRSERLVLSLRPTSAAVALPLLNVPVIAPVAASTLPTIEPPPEVLMSIAPEDEIVPVPEVTPNGVIATANAWPVGPATM